MVERDPPRGRSQPRLRPDLGLGRDNGLLFWAHFASGFGYALFISIWTIYIERLGASSTQIGLVVGGAAIVRTVLVVPAGALADRISPKPLIVGMMALPVPGAIVLLLATEWWHALVGAVLLDMPGIAIPAVSVYIATAAPEDQRTRAYTYIFNLAGVAGLAIGPAIGGRVADTTGFRAVFGLAAACFAASVVIFALIRNRRPEAVGHRQDREEIAGYRQLLRLPAVWVVLGFHTLVPLLIFTGTTLLPNFLEDERGLGVGTIGLLGSLGSGAAFAFSLLVSHWKPLARPFFGMGVSCALVTAAFVLFLASELLPLLALGYMLRMSFSSVWSLMAAAVADVTPERARGRAYGLCELGVGVGDTGGPLAAGALYGRGHLLPILVGLLSSVPLAIAAFVAHRFRDRLAYRDPAGDGDTRAAVAATN
jgi:MFS family permease